MKTFKVSLVIPVYNEAALIADCLDRAIAQQGATFHEIVIVDNNSTDDTAKIVRGYQTRYDNIKLLTESRQGQVFAQHTGFDAATGDILGRIDADTHLPKDWLTTLFGIFEAQPDLIAVVGDGTPYDMHFPRFSKWVFNTYYRISRFMAGRVVLLWGANMAVTKDAWRHVRTKVRLQRNVWEDYDLGFCLHGVGPMRFADNLHITCSYRAVFKPLWVQIPYQFRSVRTFYYHRGLLRAALFCLVWSGMTLLGPLLVFDLLCQKIALLFSRKK